MTMQFGTSGAGGGGGELLPTQAIVDDGQIVTATGGQVIDISVENNVANFSVRSFPFWNPFTVNVASLTGDWAGSMGFALGGGGSITNQPVDGYTLLSATSFDDGGTGIFGLEISGPRPLRDILLGALVGINSIDYTLSYDDMSVFPDGANWKTNIELSDVPLWTDGQNIPIVIIPQNGG